jgi:hypothetical protein
VSFPITSTPSTIKPPQIANNFVDSVINFFNPPSVKNPPAQKPLTPIQKPLTYAERKANTDAAYKKASAYLRGENADYKQALQSFLKQTGSKSRIAEFEKIYGVGSAQKEFEKNHKICKDNKYTSREEYIYQAAFFGAIPNFYGDPKKDPAGTMKAGRGYADGSVALDRESYPSGNFKKDNHPKRTELEKTATLMLAENMNSLTKYNNTKDRYEEIYGKGSFDKQYKANQKLCADRLYNKIQEFAYQDTFFFHGNYDGFRFAPYGLDKKKTFEEAHYKATVKAQKAIQLKGIDENCTFLPALNNLIESHPKNSRELCSRWD